jgi:hypothetical protein
LPKFIDHRSSLIETTCVNHTIYLLVRVRTKIPPFRAFHGVRRIGTTGPIYSAVIYHLVTPYLWRVIHVLLIPHAICIIPYARHVRVNAGLVELLRSSHRIQKVANCKEQGADERGENAAANNPLSRSIQAVSPTPKMLSIIL